MKEQFNMKTELQYDPKTAKEIAKTLGPDWQFAKSKGHERYFNIEYIGGEYFNNEKERPTLGFYVDTYRKKFEISASAPNRKYYSGHNTRLSDFTHLGSENKEWTEKLKDFDQSISSGIETDAKRIAQGIKRRILDGGYLDFYKKCVEYRDRENNRTEDKYLTTQTLASMCGGTSKENKFEGGGYSTGAYISEGYVSTRGVDINDIAMYEVSMKLNHLSLSQAETICQLMKKFAKVGTDE